VPESENFTRFESIKFWEKKKEIKTENSNMRPPHFGQDITNTQQNNNSSGDRNDDDDTSEQNRIRQECIISRLTQNGATPVAHIAGKGIIRVVSRCEDAKENSNLGERLTSVLFSTTCAVQLLLVVLS
jgi:hypothetical protein